MSRILETWPDRKNPGFKGGPKYNWKVLFDGQIHCLKQGEDFEGSEGRFRTTTFAAARVRGIKVRTAWDADTREFVIQAVLSLKLVAQSDHMDCDCLSCRPWTT